MANKIDKIYNLLEYVGIRSKSYSHSISAVAYQPDDPLPYYLNQSARASYGGPFDSSGIPLMHMRQGPAYFPIFIGLYGLGQFEIYRQTSGADSFVKAESVATWFCNNQTDQGTWLTHSPVRKFGLTHPWPSAMGQGLAISCLTRIYKITGREQYLARAIKALNPYRIGFDNGGVAYSESGDIFYDEYPSGKGCHVLNGFIFALWGLYDLYRICNNPKAKSLYNNGLNTLIKFLPQYDTGYWSLYHIANGLKNPASIPYHRLHINQLQAMYLISENKIFKQYALLWERYLNSRFNALQSLPAKLRWIVANEVLA